MECLCTLGAKASRGRGETRLMEAWRTAAKAAGTLRAFPDTARNIKKVRSITGHYVVRDCRYGERINCDGEVDVENFSKGRLLGADLSI